MSDSARRARQPAADAVGADSDTADDEAAAGQIATGHASNGDGAGAGGAGNGGDGRDGNGVAGGRGGGGGAAGGDDAAIWTTVGRAREWLDTTNGRGHPELSMRILKVAEEYGEAAAAWIGATGQNPRKGITHTLDDVAAELGDIAFTALVAAASLGYDPRTVLAAVATKVSTRLAPPATSPAPPASRPARRPTAEDEVSP